MLLKCIWVEARRLPNGWRKKIKSKQEICGRYTCWGKRRKCWKPNDIYHHVIVSNLPVCLWSTHSITCRTYFIIKALTCGTYVFQAISYRILCMLWEVLKYMWSEYMLHILFPCAIMLRISLLISNILSHLIYLFLSKYFMMCMCINGGFSSLHISENVFISSANCLALS